MGFGTVIVCSKGKEPIVSNEGFGVPAKQARDGGPPLLRWQWSLRENSFM